MAALWSRGGPVCGCAPGGRWLATPGDPPALCTRTQLLLNGLPRVRCSLRAGTRAEAPPTGTRLSHNAPTCAEAGLYVGEHGLTVVYGPGLAGALRVGWGQLPRPPLTCCWGHPGCRPGPSGVPVPPVPDRSLVLPDQGVEVSRCPALDAEGAVEGARCCPHGCQQGQEATAPCHRGGWLWPLLEAA